MKAQLRAGTARIVRAADRGRAWHGIAWLLVLAALVAAAALRVQGGGVTSDLLLLLPSVREDPLLARAVDRSRNAFLQDLVIAVTGADADRVAAAAQAAHAKLDAAGYRLDDATAAGERLVSFYRAHRFALLTPADAQALAAQPVQTFVARLEAGLAMPGSPGGGLADPGGFFARYLASLPRPFPQLVPENGLLAVPDAPQPAYLLTLTLSGAAFGAAGEQQAQGAVAAARAAVTTACRGCRVFASGPALYSAAERGEAKDEVSWLSTASTLLIVLLVLGVFRSPRPLLLTVACLASGIVAGAAVTFVIFRQINLLTLVFGTTLLGIAVDYAFHYLADRRLSAGPGTLARVAPGLTLGLVTSVIAFAFLAATAFPALRQIATLSIAGLAGAFLSVFTLFPRLAGGGSGGTAPPYLQRLARLSSAGGHRWRGVATALLVVAAAGGLARLHALDDLRELQAIPPQLAHQTAAVDRLLGTPPARGFLFVRGADLQQALARERELEARAATIPGAVLVGLGGFLPAPAAQRRALAAWHAVLGADGATLTRAVQAAGLPAPLVEPLAAAWRRAPRRIITAPALFAAAPALRRFSVAAGGATGLLVQVYGNVGGAALERLAASVPGAAYVDPLARLNDTFARIRRHATLWVGVGYAVILLLLFARYGLLGGAAAMLPPIAAAGVTLGLLGWIGQPINVFVVVALMLVAGIGVDYAVFLREGASRHHAATALAVALAALTTLASFGLLALSRIPSIHAFGLTVAIGIVVSWLAAPLALAGAGRTR